MLNLVMGLDNCFTVYYCAYIGLNKEVTKMRVIDKSNIPVVVGKTDAMQCFGRIVRNIILDPDPETQADLTKEYDCKNCDSYSYCCELADTL